MGIQCSPWLDMPDRSGNSVRFCGTLSPNNGGAQTATDSCVPFLYWAGKTPGRGTFRAINRLRKDEKSTFKTVSVPFRAAAMAAPMPPGPPPTTTASHSRTTSIVLLGSGIVLIMLATRLLINPIGRHDAVARVV
jgi:hypothetical protein